MELNVLWIDDMPNEAFMDRAYEKGIVITNKLNVDAGIEEILAPTSSYDAIVLDANCLKHKSDEDSMPEVSALQYALQCLSKKDIMLPCLFIQVVDLKVRRLFLTWSRDVKETMMTVTIIRSHWK